MSTPVPGVTPTAEPAEVTPGAAPGVPTEQRERQQRRERALLVTALVLVTALLLLQRIGTRVWAVAVYDPAERTFVEHVYVLQKEQAQRALNLVLTRAQLTHPFYRTAEGAPLFGASAPSFEQAYRIEPARRMIQLLPGTSAATPVVTAADALTKVLRPVVDAWAIYDTGAKATIAVLPTESMAKLVLDQRLAEVSAKVRADLGARDRLVSAGFLQQVQVQRIKKWPVTDVMTVPQAVAYLANGTRRDAQHVVADGESAKCIAAKYDAKIEDLAAWNPGRDLTHLRVGDAIMVRRPDAPLTVLTVERRTYHQDGQTVTMDVRRHNGVETNRQPAEQSPTP